ncbi:hypothetical protein OUZ56_029000 [Daphnia magna]|uniref:Uncharacterized protein n=1 Tax=Daphnia magna TaxID=35525 RepID=A0ABR0B5H9_9CRUS|nr:hypothetical protein OUZ56_029000 [Daphnia magna]
MKGSHTAASRKSVTQETGNHVCVAAVHIRSLVETEERIVDASLPARDGRDLHLCCLSICLLADDNLLAIITGERERERIIDRDFRFKIRDSIGMRNELATL